MDRCDVLIVGGGPGGSSCARPLVRAGFDVVVLDRATFPRDKTCAGWITPAVVDALELPLDEYGRVHTCQPITGFRTRVAEGPVVETAFGAPVSYGICRIEFDDYLLRRCGARLRLGTGLTSLRRSAGGWVVNEEIEAPIVVGAGGHFCPVARHMGARPADEPIVAAQEIEFRMTPDQASRCTVNAEVPYLVLCHDLRGYGWCFRKGDHLNVGLGRQDRHALTQHVRDFLATLVVSGIVPPDTPARWKGHAYLLRDLSPRAVIDDGLLLVGDAAGLASTHSGEGIRPAVESGLMAAASIVAARGRYGRQDLRGYQHRIDQRFPRSGGGRLAAIPRGLLVPVVEGLMGTRWFTRRVLIEKWFLQTGTPALAA